MKLWMTVFALLAVSSTTFAANSSRCEKQILEIVQTNMDLKSKSFRVRDVEGRPMPANIQDDTLKIQDMFPNGASATVQVYIMKGIFKVDVKVDGFCGLETLQITDQGEY